jgi:hypothetical protein
MKPVSASEVLKTQSFVHRNRFEALAPVSDSMPGKTNTVRDRANSVKRKASGEINDENQKKANVESHPVIAAQSLDSMERKIMMIMMKGISKKMNEDAAKVKLDPILENIIRYMCEFVDVSVSYHEELVKNCPVEVNFQSEPTQVPVTEGDSQDADSEVFVTYSHVAKRPHRVVAAPDKPVQKKPKDPKIQAFQDAVKHAERSTLVFNLDLGTKKTLNEKTILTQVTLALSAAASEVEGRGGRGPTRETVAALDDVMSVTQNVVLYGKVTRPYENKKNPQDPKNKSFFTLPVRYEFKDKETRLEAETILRDTCKIDCTTPYPAKLY